MRPAVCHFLTYLNRADTSHLGKNVLECGAGGTYPPLALFYERGYTPYGIDISDEQIERARAFCRDHAVELTIIKGDMRKIPFSSETFSLVYECDSMCHLTKKDTSRTIKEMRRVLQRGGYLSVGFISLDYWPLSGEERNPGEFWSQFEGEEYVHSYFEDSEPDNYFTDLDIVWKQKETVLYHDRFAHMSEEEWLEWYDDTWTQYSRDQWVTLYSERASRYRYSTLQYIARKPL